MSERAWLVTRGQLIDALANIEIRGIKTTGPMAGQVIADDVADAILSQLAPASLRRATGPLRPGRSASPGSEPGRATRPGALPSWRPAAPGTVHRREGRRAMSEPTVTCSLCRRQMVVRPDGRG